VPEEPALGALAAALFGTLQPPYYGQSEFAELLRALGELEEARAPGAALLLRTLAPEPPKEPETEGEIEPGAQPEAPAAAEAGAEGAETGVEHGGEQEGAAATEEAGAGARKGTDAVEEASAAGPPVLRAADVRELLEEALKAEGGGGGSASVAGAAELREALERVLTPLLGDAPLDDPDAEVGAEALAAALTAVAPPPSAPTGAPHGKWWDWQEGKVSW